MAKLFTNETRRPVGCPASRPVAGFEQNGLQQPDFDHLAGHAVDLNPVAHADAVAPHQHEPSKECDDEILHRHRQPGARQAEHRRRLRGHAENNEADHDRAHRLRRKFHHRPQRVDPLVLRRHAREQAFNHPVRQVHRQQNQQNPQHDSIRWCSAARSRVSTSAIQLA